MRIILVTSQQVVIIGEKKQPAYTENKTLWNNEQLHLTVMSLNGTTVQNKSVRTD